VGCYSGEITGVWTTSSRMAMKSFVDRANAALPIDNPDAVLLSLVRNYQGQACATDCPPGQVAPGGACSPPATLARATEDPAPAKDAAAVALPAAAAAGLAAATPRPADEKRPVTGTRTPVASAPYTVPSEHTRPSSPETKPVNKMRERRARRQKTPEPPKIIRDFLRTVERTFRPR
jgi:hypothetical protein